MSPEARKMRQASRDLMSPNARKMRQASRDLMSPKARRQRQYGRARFNPKKLKIASLKMTFSGKEWTGMEHKLQ